ncbi:YhdP family protein [Pseudoroseomonas ludipueritiae]|uniref:DUF3971 domain-containing protein n=1 Tax=Pseudoroseomonas ludipueritiae TaxID=198093 RepID=A0ABR7R458_9PROT|nr:AsmA-like C-terminal region-containing protein [Pseudoroseomonas ludipueritiae]MBC9176542.1 DUF3971 domain-containing protein [Pseudoroseomonas ludipueritiae]
MPGLTGQAFRAGGRICSALLRAAMGLLLLAGLGLAALSWRLAEGPMHVPILTRVVEQMIARAGLQRNVEVSDIVLAWGGFRGGQASPLAVRVSGVRVLDEAGALRQELPDIAVSFSLARLLLGNVSLTEVTLRDPAIVLERDEEGGVSLAMGHLAGGADASPDSTDLLAELLGSENGSGLFSALRNILITNGSLTILDRQLHLTWKLQGVGLALRRVGRDGAEGEGVAQLVLPGGGGTVPVRLTAKASSKGPRVEGTLEVPALEPARLAGLMPALAPLGLVNASVSMDVHGLLDGANRGSPQLSLGLRVGEGSLALRPGLRMPFKGMELRASGSPEDLRLERLALTLPPTASRPDAVPPVINATGQAALRQGRWRGGLTLALNRMEVSALGAYWPEDLATNARRWLVENVTAGVATGGSFKLAAESAEDLSGLRLTEASGTLQVEQATVHWLRPVPPVENVTGTVQLGLKEVVVQANSGRQAGTALNASGVTVRLFALDTDAEQMEITGRLRGPVPDAVNLIRHPRLKLFEKRPLDLKQPGGQLDATLRLATPLLVDLPADAIRVSVQAHLTALRLADVVAGQDLQRGTADLTVDNGRLRATGDAQVGGIPAKLSVEMDFRPGPPSQVVERVQASGRTDIASLERFGLDLDGLAAGPVSVEAVMEKPRSGETRVDLRGDLQDATMTLTPLAWRKAPGQPATARAELRAAGENLRSLRNLRVEAPQLSLRGGGSFTQDNRLQQLDLEDVALGRSRFGGVLRPPARQGGAWMISLRGPVLDLMPALTAEKPPEPAAPAGQDSDPPADIVVEGRFDRVLLDQNRFLTGVQGQIRADGAGTLRQGRVSGRVQNNAPFDVAVTPRGAGRDLRLTSEDGGALLAAFDVLQQVRGGKLSVNAHWANNRPDAVLSGTAELQDFSVLDAPAVGKLLQALTVYGVFDAVQGPGLAFSHLNAPFSLSPQRLTVRDAHAFSPSLGVTVKGEMNRAARSLAFDGTIVPAYALNTALGRLPLVGRLFSPEKGGGLFAAAFKVTGPVENPNVSVNPLSMLTPGFLRGLFGGGQSATP